MAYGQKSELGIIFQDSYGTPGSVNSIHYIPFLSETLKLNIPPMYSENIRGVFDEGDTYEGPRTVDGEIDSEAQPIAVGALLKSILNEVTVTQSIGLYTRTFRPRVSDFDSISANNPITAYAYLDNGSAMLFSDLNGATLEIGIANGEFLKTKVSYVGGNFTQNAQVAASFPIGKRWTWDQTSVSIGGTANTEIVNMTITLDDGALEAMHTVRNSKYPSRIKRTGWRTVAVDGTLKFDNQNEYQQFISQSERELIMTFKNNVEVQSGYFEEVTIKLPKLRYEEIAPTAEGPGEIEVGVTARGKYSIDSGTALEITLVNTQVSY